MVKYLGGTQRMVRLELSFGIDECYQFDKFSKFLRRKQLSVWAFEKDLVSQQFEPLS